eukprot:1855587-Pleurochrysis_carterae.AAC.2
MRADYGPGRARSRSIRGPRANTRRRAGAQQQRAFELQPKGITVSRRSDEGATDPDSRPRLVTR